MKKVLLFVLAFGVIWSGCGKKEENANAPAAKKETISISGAFALYPLVVRWAEEYQKLNPGIRIDVSAGGAGKGMADVLAGMVDVAMVSRAVQEAEAAKGAWFVAVAKDAVVPMININNPCLAALQQKGMKREQFTALWIDGASLTWEEAVGAKNKEKSAIRLYTRSDSCGAAETWAQLLGKKQENLKGLGVYADPGLAQAVKKDPLGIGYNNVNYAYDATTRRPVEGLAVLPVDWDNSGKIEPAENFYETRESLIQAIGDGRYPSPPARNLLFVCKGSPSRPAVRQFLKWVLEAGQNYLGEAGYITPGEKAIQESRAKLQ